MRGLLSRVSAAGRATHAPVRGAARIGAPRGLPPTLVVTAQNDVLHVEAEKYAGCLISSGVLTQVIRYPDITHAALATHEAAFEEAVRFFQCRFQARQPNRPE